MQLSSQTCRGLPPATAALAAASSGSAEHWAPPPPPPPPRLKTETQALPCLLQLLRQVCTRSSHGSGSGISDDSGSGSGSQAIVIPNRWLLSSQAASLELEPALQAVTAAVLGSGETSGAKLVHMAAALGHHVAMCADISSKALLEAHVELLTAQLKALVCSCSRARPAGRHRCTPVSLSTESPGWPGDGGHERGRRRPGQPGVCCRCCCLHYFSALPLTLYGGLARQVPLRTVSAAQQPGMQGPAPCDCSACCS